MLQMILNNNENEVIEITTYTRTLDVGNPAVKVGLSVSMTDGYSPASFEYLMNYAGTTITSIVIKDAGDNILVNSTNVVAKLSSLNENCDVNGRYGYASILILNPTEEDPTTDEEMVEQ